MLCRLFALGDVNRHGVKVSGLIGERAFAQYYVSDNWEGDSVWRDLRSNRHCSCRSSFDQFQPAGVFTPADRHSQPVVWRYGMGLVLSICESRARRGALHDSGLA